MGFSKRIIKKSMSLIHFLRTDSSSSFVNAESWVVFGLFAGPTDTWRPAIGSFLINFFLSDKKKIQKPTYVTVHGLMVLLGFRVKAWRFGIEI